LTALGPGLLGSEADPVTNVPTPRADELQQFPPSGRIGGSSHDARNPFTCGD
jgi:hypothetical protein